MEIPIWAITGDANFDGFFSLVMFFAGVAVTIGLVIGVINRS